MMGRTGSHLIPDVFIGVVVAVTVVVAMSYHVCILSKNMIFVRLLYKFY